MFYKQNSIATLNGGIRCFIDRLDNYRTSHPSDYIPWISFLSRTAPFEPNAYQPTNANSSRISRPHHLTSSYARILPGPLTRCSTLHFHSASLSFLSFHRIKFSSNLAGITSTLAASLFQSSRTTGQQREPCDHIHI